MMINWYKLYEQAESDLLLAEQLLGQHQNQYLYCLSLELLGRVKMKQEAYNNANNYLLRSYQLAKDIGATTTEKSSALFVDDLWMYSYDNRTYNGTIATVFSTIQEV